MHEHEHDKDNTERIMAHYANYLEVGHNKEEFLFDFGQLYQEDERLHVHTRIVTAPAYAKAFLKTLQNALYEYEDKFGMVEEM
jgi:hypothetical protein